MLLGAFAVAVSLVAAVTSVGSGPARAARRAGTASSPHVVIVGISGLRWTDISASAALLTASAVAVFVVIACGWPQFGGKVGGTIAIVPCFLLLLMAMAGIRITIRRVAVVLGSGVAVFAVFALINYLIPATSPSDIGAFAGNLFHGR